MADLNSFKANLANDNYGGITGARRAIGKFHDVTDEDRAKMHIAANKHFDAEASGAKKPANPKAPKVAKTPKATKAPKTPKKADVKSADAPTTATPKATRGRKPGQRTEAPAPAAAAGESAAAVSGQQLKNIELAITSLKTINAIDGNIGVSAELNKARVQIGFVLDNVVTASQAVGAASKPTAVTYPANGMSSMPTALQP